MKKILYSAQQTKSFGYNFASALNGGEIILLFGEMGCGKTIFTKGIAEGLGINREVLSPTFTIMNEYQGDKLHLYHIDAYRLKDVTQAEETGLFDYFGSADCIYVIEWPEALLPVLKNYNCKKFYFSYIDENTREVTYDQ